MSELNIRITHRAAVDCNPAETIVELGRATDPAPEPSWLSATLESGSVVALPQAMQRAPIKVAADGTHLPADYRGTDHVAVLHPATGVMYGMRRLGGKKGRPQRDVLAEARDVDLLGCNDWQLWTPHQAFPVVNHAFFKPAVDPNLYPCITPDFFWCDQDTHEAWSSASAFGVLFDLGVVYDFLRSLDGFGLPVRVVGQ